MSLTSATQAWKLQVEGTSDAIDQLVGYIQKECPALSYKGCVEQQPATAEEIKWARDWYCDSQCDLEIDEDAGASRSDDGTWVQAWVWLPKPEADEEEEED